jgi:hypothetical protein
VGEEGFSGVFGFSGAGDSSRTFCGCPAFGADRGGVVAVTGFFPGCGGFAAGGVPGSGGTATGGVVTLIGAPGAGGDFACGDGGTGGIPGAEPGAPGVGAGVPGAGSGFLSSIRAVRSLITWSIVAFAMR